MIFCSTVKALERWPSGFRPEADPPWAERLYYTMQYVYILKSQKTGELYKERSSDLKTRFKAHNEGKVVSTKHGLPWKLVYYEAFSSLRDAYREELFLKSGKGRERIRWMLRDI